MGRIPFKSEERKNAEFDAISRQRKWVHDQALYRKKFAEEIAANARKIANIA